MKNNLEVIKILNLFRKYGFLDKLYFEGGFSLNFLYKLNRVFSGDIDFTVETSEVESELKKLIPHIVKDISESYKSSPNYFIGSNSIQISINNENYMNIDYFIVPKNLFEWEKVKVMINSNSFHIRSHTLIDILAEKVCCMFDKNRFQFKDLWDIYLINKVRRNKYTKDFLEILNKKYSSKDNLCNNISRKKYYKSFKNSFYYKELSCIKFDEVFREAKDFGNNISYKIINEKS